MSQKIYLETLANLEQLTVDQLEVVELQAGSMRRIRSQGKLSLELRGEDRGEELEADPLALRARALLENLDLEISLTLADQALLACLIIKGEYFRKTFSSREINDVIEEVGRPRVVHITSAIGGLLEKGILSGTTKSMELSPEGYRRGRSLVEMIEREAEAA